MRRRTQKCCGILLLQGLIVAIAVQHRPEVRARAGHPVYVLPGMFHGLSNQRICIANTIALAIKMDWNLVLPDLRFNYPDLSNLFTVPFHFFFDVSELDSLKKLGLSIVQSLPNSKHHACMIQLQLRPSSYSFEKISTPDLEAMESWAKRDGVVCLHDLITIDNPWMEDLMSPSLKSQIRKALLPSKKFRREIQEVTLRIKNKIGAVDFVALHARIEDDWKDYCGADWFKDMLCYVGDDGLLVFLQNVARVTSGSPVYIASGADANKLSRVCDAYKCFTRDDVWQPEASLIPHADQQLVKAYMDFLITQLAQTFIGNRLSTFSMELFHIFNDTGKTALFVNQLKCPPGKKITYSGCQPVNFMDCCI